MSLPTSEPLPADETAPVPVRPRRRRQVTIPAGVEGQAAFLRELAHRVTPSFDFYLFTFLAGLALAMAIILDSAPFFVLAALLSPFMAPVVGLAFSAILGSARFSFQMLGALSLGSLVMFAWGALAGWLARFWPELSFRQVALHGDYTWPDLILLVLGAGMTAYALVRAPQQRPLVTSVAVAYELYLPAGAAGFGLVSGQGILWPNGLLIFLLNLSLAALVGSVVLVALGLKPLNGLGYLLGALLAVICLAALLLANNSKTFTLDLFPAAGSAIAQTAPASSGAPALFTPTAAASSTQSPQPAPTQTQTAAPTRTPTNTLVPSRTPTVTFTPVPTPMWAYISAKQGGGALVRSEPGFNAPLAKTLINGLLVQVLPDTAEADNVTWAHIRTSDGIEGWIVSSLLTTATPVPVW